MPSRPPSHAQGRLPRALRAQDPPVPDRARGRPRRHADRRDLRLHRHDQQLVRPDLHGDEQGHRRLDHAERRPGDRGRLGAADPRLDPAQGPGAARRAERRGLDLRPERRRSSARTTSAWAPAARRTSSRRRTSPTASRPSRSARGGCPKAADEVVLDKATARKEKYKVGDTVADPGRDARSATTGSSGWRRSRAWTPSAAPPWR